MERSYRKKKPYILGIVPARKGSKRLPDKNIKLLNRRPLIDYIIKTALKSRNLDAVIVTTDSEKIRKIAIKSGASVPFLRPKKLAQDGSSTEQALRHAVLFMEKFLGQRIDIIVLLQATSPFTNVKTIDASIDLLLKKDWDSVITVKQASDRAEWTGFINKKGGFEEIINQKEYFELSRIKEYVPSGNVYVFKRNTLFKQRKIIGKNTGVIIIPREYALDIDYPIDFMFAKFLIKHNIFKYKG